MRVHGTTGEAPIARFERDEAAALKPVAGRAPFRQLRELVRVVQSDACIELDTNRYSVPWRLIRATVTVLAGEEGIVVSHAGAEVARNEARRGRRERAIRPEHLDGIVGAAGVPRAVRSILVPQVNTADAARAIAGACRYPPIGRRGYAAPIVRASGYGARPGYALTESHDELLLMVQCEHVEAVDNLGEIAAVDGIDIVFVGPNDLAGSIAHLERTTEPEPQALLARIEAFAAGHGTLLGTICGAGRDWADLRRLGYRFVIGPNDVSLIVNGARAAAAERDAAVDDAPDAERARATY